MIGVMIVPTGLGCEIGGHAGDALPASKLLASVCSTLIVHPNVVNSADINEMTDNMLYVEGSILDRFLEGTIELQKVKSNRILVVVNPPIDTDTINYVSATRATIGLEATILALKTPLQMIAMKDENGCATGIVKGWEELVDQVKDMPFDALSIQTPITVEDSVVQHYIDHGGVNPWGGVEAHASKLIATSLNKPVAHSPYDPGLWGKQWSHVADPRMASEFVSLGEMFCVLKGLHKAPRIAWNGLTVEEVDVMVSPYGIWGRPHRACQAAGIPIIMVKENKTVLDQLFPIDVILVENYLEAVGYIKLLELGMTRESVTRPLSYTKVIDGTS